jgi:hypothetical protein
MRKTPRHLTAQMERSIEMVLAPGHFISYKANVDFVRDLEAAEKQIALLVLTEPKRAVSLYESFLAGCYAKAEEIDDSSGSFGQFVAELFRAWIKARQASGSGPHKTAARLLAWMDNDSYGFCYQLEKDAAKILDRAGRAAFETQVRERFEATATSAAGESSRRNTDYQRRRWSEMLRAIYLNQNNVGSYIRLCDATQLTGQDCHALAIMLVAQRKSEEALTWVERGLALDKQNLYAPMAGLDLARLKRGLLTKLGRGNEALEAAWAEFHKHPDKYSYDDLMQYVPKEKRAAWHEKAMDAARTTDLHSLMQLLLETKELERLANLVGQNKDGALEDVSHYTTEPAARKLEKTHPEAAARLWCAQGMRVIKAKKSKYYGAALENFERVRRCYERAGLINDWHRVVDEVCSEHYRKTGFMSGFEEVVAGSGPSEKPSFLERAKARWSAPQAERIETNPGR